jgi:hypothetical protein
MRPVGSAYGGVKVGDPLQQELQQQQQMLNNTINPAIRLQSRGMNELGGLNALKSLNNNGNI